MVITNLRNSEKPPVDGLYIKIAQYLTESLAKDLTMHLTKY